MVVRDSWTTRGSVVVIGLAIAISLLLLPGNKPPPPPRLHVTRAGVRDGGLVVAMPGTNVIPDDLRQKYAPPRRAEFRVSCDKETSIFLLATGVQVATSSGWQTTSEDYRGEICRLRTGVEREICVERPDAETWRAYIRYGTEMKGLRLVRAQVKEAWLGGSLSNWTGKAWGGGRWSGSYELFSAEVRE